MSVPALREDPARACPRGRRENLDAPADGKERTSRGQREMRGLHVEMIQVRMDRAETEGWLFPVECGMYVVTAGQKKPRGRFGLNRQILQV